MMRNPLLALCGLFGYGLAHSIPVVNSRQARQVYGYSAVPDAPLLWTDRAGLLLLFTACTPFTWPMMVREDLVKLECLLRGKRVTDYLPEDKD
jgi:hypothetical protein